MAPTQSPSWRLHFSAPLLHIAQCGYHGFKGLSANSSVVGYQNKDVRKNLSVQLATFDDIGTAGMDIQNIKPVPPDGEDLASGDFVIQIYGDTGAIQTSYMYVLGEDIDDGYPDGWYEEDWETIVDKTFATGEAFNLSMAVEGASLQYAGQVNGEETLVPVRKNLSAQGNIRPTSVDIQDIIPVVGESDTLESGDFVIQIYGDTGAIQTSYMYVLGEDIDDGYPDGWYEEDWETLVVKTFAAGEGFNVSAAKAGYLKFPEL